MNEKLTKVQIEKVCVMYFEERMHANKIASVLGIAPKVVYAKLRELNADIKSEVGKNCTNCYYRTGEGDECYCSAKGFYISDASKRCAFHETGMEYAMKTIRVVKRKQRAEKRLRERAERLAKFRENPNNQEQQ